jgi:fermentation-respiration switch protein FrsA (DUF1100 family)
VRALLATLLAAAALAGCGGDDKVSAPPGPPPLPDKFSYDRSKPLRARAARMGGELGRKSRAAGIPLEKVSYAAADGERVPALFARPPDERGPYPCVIFENGLSSKKEDAAFVLPTLTGQGVGVFTIDARYHGERATRRLDFARAAGEGRTLARMVRGTVLDLRRALDYLETRRECNPDRLGYVGISLTAIAGTLFAAADKRVKAPALLVGGGNWAEIARGNSILLERDRGSRRRLRSALRRLAPLDPVRYAAHISPRQVLMINGREDATITPPAARALHGAAREPKKVVWYRGGHQVFGLSSEQNVNTLLDWLRDELISPPNSELRGG